MEPTVEIITHAPNKRNAALCMLVTLLAFNPRARPDVLATAAMPADKSPANKPATGIIQHDPMVALGRNLFFDARLSRDNSVSCASCHRPEKAFSDGKPVAEGLGSQTGTRNTPSLLNASYTQDKFWDGRRASLVAQVLDPYTNAKEHGLKDKADLVDRFKAL